MSAFRVFWRQVRADASSLLTLAAILLVSATLASAFPRWLNVVEDDAIRYTLEQGQEIDDIMIRYDGRHPSTVDGVVQLGSDFEAQFESPLDDLAGEAVVTSRVRDDWEIATIDGVPIPEGPVSFFLTPRMLITSTQELTYIAGRPPVEGQVEEVQVGEELVELRVVEVAVSVDTAQAIGLEPEHLVVLRPGGVPLALRVAGLFEPVDPDAYVWQRNTQALEPTMINGGENGAMGEAVVPAESVASMFAAYTAEGPEPRVTTSYTFPLDVDRIEAAHAAPILQAANRLQSRPLDVPVVGSPYRVQTTIQESIERFLGQRATARAVGGVGAAGLLVAVVAVLALAAQMTAERRRASLALARARGGTLRQLAGLAAVESFLVAALAGTAGWYLGTLVVDARPSAMSGWLVGLLVVAATTAATTIVAWEHRVVGRTERRDLGAARATPRRLAAELAVVVLAVVGVVLLRRRGLSASVIQGSADPFMLLVPVLVALTVAVVVLRIYPIPLRFAGEVLARRRGPIGFLGLARAGRDPSGTATPLVVLLVALAFAVFSSVVAHSIRVEQETLSWQQVGAEIRIDANAANVFDPEADVATVAASAGISPAQVLGVHRQPTAVVSGLGGAGAEFDLLVLDPAAYERFVESWPVPAPDLGALADAPDGTAERFPALVSPGFVERVLVGEDEVSVFLPGTEAVLEPVGVLAGFPGTGRDASWAITRVADAERVADLAYWPSQLFLDAPGAEPAAVEAAAIELQPFAVTTDRDETFATTRDAPLTGAVQTSFLLSFGIAAGYCALAIVLALVVTGQARSRNLSFLRTLGLSERQARGLVAWEIVPMAAITAAFGVALGVVLPGLVGPAIDLRPFTGGLRAAPLHNDLPMIAALTGGMLVVVVVTTLLVAALNRRLGLGSALRVGEDT